MPRHFAALFRATIGSLPFIFLASSIAAAQSPAPVARTGTGGQHIDLRSPEFARLIQGKPMVVTTSDGLERQDVFTVSPDGLIAKGQQSAAPIPFDRISKVQKASFRIRHHTLIGLAVGAAVGALVACTSDDCSNDAPFWLPVASGGAGIGAGIGCGVGAILNALNRKSDVIYDTRQRRTTVAFAPILSSTRTGVAFSMTWR